MKSKSWFKITNDAVTDSATIIIFGDIEPVTARDFVEQFKNLGEKDLTLRVNSYGGDFFSALAIYNLLRAHRRKVEIIVDGCCCSAASLVACAGRVIMPANAWLMVHAITGSPEQETLRQVEQSLIDAYVQKTKLSEQRIRELVTAGTWMNAEVALELGFADEITEPVALAARAELSKFQNLPEALKSIAASVTDPAPTTPAPTDDPPQPTPRMMNKIFQEATAIVEARNNEQARRNSMKEASAIITACADHGNPSLAADFLDRGLSLDQVKVELAKPENVSSATATGSGEEIKRIYGLCREAGVVDLAERFIAEARTVGWVENRLADAPKIRARCAAAGMPHRADAFIRAGVTAEEAGNSLLELKIAMQGPEIDNSISPDMMLGVKPEAHAHNGNGHKRTMTVAEVYAMRNRRGVDGDRINRISKALAEALK